MQCQNNSLNGSLYFRIVFWIILVNTHINCPSQFIPTVLHGLSQGWFFFDSSKTCKNDQTWSYPLAHQQVKYRWHLTAQCLKRLFLPVRPPSGKILGIQNQKFLNAGRSKCVGCFQYDNFHNVSGHIVARNNMMAKTYHIQDSKLQWSLWWSHSHIARIFFTGSFGYLVRFSKDCHIHLSSIPGWCPRSFIGLGNNDCLILFQSPAVSCRQWTHMFDLIFLILICREICEKILCRTWMVFKGFG